MGRPTHILSIQGSGVNVEYAELTEKRAKDIIAHGISEEDLADIWTDCESGPKEVSVLIDDIAMTELDINTFESESTHVISRATRKSWYLVKDEWHKGEFGRAQIEGPFDANRLACSRTSFEINGHSFSYLNIEYEGAQLEFGGTDTKASSVFIIDPHGQRNEFEVTSDED